MFSFVKFRSRTQPSEKVVRIHHIGKEVTKKAVFSRPLSWLCTEHEKPLSSGLWARGHQLVIVIVNLIHYSRTFISESTGSRVSTENKSSHHGYFSFFQ